MEYAIFCGRKNVFDTKKIYTVTFWIFFFGNIPLLSIYVILCILCRYIDYLADILQFFLLLNLKHLWSFSHNSVLKLKFTLKKFSTSWSNNNYAFSINLKSGNWRVVWSIRGNIYSCYSLRIYEIAMLLEQEVSYS